jgi:hypothetical protein
MNSCQCQLENVGQVIETQTVDVVDRDLDFKVNVALENRGTEPAFDTKMILALPYNAQLPRGFDDCDNITDSSSNKELNVPFIFVLFVFITVSQMTKVTKRTW